MKEPKQQTAQRRAWRMRTAFIVALSMAAALFGILPATASIGVTIINTDGQGVASRSAPYIGSTNGYGAPAGAAVTAICWTWGDSVGPYSNRLWWLIQYAGRQFYAADRYLSTPNNANQPPPGQPQCGSTPTPPPVAAGTDPSVWVGSPIEGRWSPYESAATHHLLGRTNPTNDFAIDLVASAGQGVVLYAAPQISSTVVTARVDTVASPACMTGGGGSYVTVGFYVSGQRIGSATYAHINPIVSEGQIVNRWGTTLGTVGAFTVDQACWTGPHVHFEMYSTHHYACYNGSFALGQAIYRSNFVGYTGGDRASRQHAACP